AGDVEDGLSLKVARYGFSQVEAAVAKPRCDRAWMSKRAILLGGQCIQFEVKRVMGNGGSLDDDRSPTSIKEARGPWIFNGSSVEMDFVAKATEDTTATGLDVRGSSRSSPESQQGAVAAGVERDFIRFGW